MKDNPIFEQILRRLDILVSLELQKPISAKYPSVTSRIQRLRELGLGPAEIASVIGKPLNYVTATISRTKAKKEGRENV